VALSKVGARAPLFEIEKRRITSSQKKKKF